MVCGKHVSPHMPKLYKVRMVASRELMMGAVGSNEDSPEFDESQRSSVNSYTPDY